MTVIKTFGKFADFTNYAAVNPSIVKSWKNDRCFTWKRVFVVKTDNNEAVVFSETLLKRIWACVSDLFRIFGSYYAKKLNTKKIEFLNPSILSPETSKTTILSNTVFDNTSKDTASADSEKIATARLNHILEKYWTSGTDTYSKKEILNLLPLVSSLPDSLNCTQSLFYILNEVDEGLLNDTVSHLKPLVVKAIVEKMLLVKPQLLSPSNKPLEKVARAITLLNSNHENVKAFVEGFPSAQQPASLASTQNYKARKKSLKYEENLDPTVQIGCNCYIFILTDSFSALFNHLPEKVLNPILKNLFSHAAQFGRCLSYKAPEELLKLSKNFPLSYQRNILEGLIYTTDALRLIQICFENQADASLLEQILSMHPKDSLDLCKNQKEIDSFNLHPDPFFNEYLEWVGKIGKVHLVKITGWLIDIVFKGDNIQRQEALLTKLCSLSTFPADHFYRIPALSSLPFPFQYGREKLLEMANHVTETEGPHNKENLKAITHELLATPDSIKLPLFFKIQNDKTLEWVMESLLKNSHLQPHLQQDLINSLLSKHYSFVAQRFLQLPQTCIDCFDKYQLMQMTEHMGKKHLLFPLVATLQEATNPDHTRLLNCLANCVFGKSSFNAKIARIFVYALSAGQIQQLPWAQYSDNVMKVIIKDLDANIPLMLPRPILRKYLEEITALNVRVKLLQTLDDDDTRLALDIWWSSFEFHSPKLINLSFPYGRLIDLIEEPSKIARLANSLQLLYNPPVATDPEEKNQNVFIDCVRTFEKSPWKLWIAIHHGATDIWFGVKNDQWLTPTIQKSFPQCYQIANWNQESDQYGKNKNTKGFFRILSIIQDVLTQNNWKIALVLLDRPKILKEKIENMIEHLEQSGITAHNVRKLAQDLYDWRFPNPHFKAIFDEDLFETVIKHGSYYLLSNALVPDMYARLDQLDSMIKAFCLAEVLGPSPEGLAKHWELDKRQLFSAIFNKEANEKLQHAILTGEMDSKKSQPLLNLLEEMLNSSSNLPEEARRTVSSFVKSIPQSIGIGGNACPLASQLNQGVFSDVILQFGTEKIAAHRAILSLDPYFKPLLHSDDNVIIFSNELSSEAKSKLKLLYGDFSLIEVLSDEGQKQLLTKSKEKLSLASLFNNITYSDITIEVEGKEIKAHKVIIASAYEYFAAVFRNNMTESAEGRVKLKELSYDEVAAVIEFAYTNEKPEFEDEASEKAFDDAHNRFNPSTK